MSKGFDLNIETVLENWELSHAIREIIANALDEQTLTGTSPIDIFQDDKHRWIIRDFHTMWPAPPEHPPAAACGKCYQPNA